MSLMVAHHMVTTQFELDGFRVVKTFGVVRGIVVRSRSIFGTLGASLQTLVGGNITLLTNLCEKTRSEAFDLMLNHGQRNAAERYAGDGEHHSGVGHLTAVKETYGDGRARPSSEARQPKFNGGFR